MASMPAKKVVRTYARQKRSLYDQEPLPKRRRVECTLEPTQTNLDLLNTSERLANNSDPLLNSSDIPPSSPKTSPAVWSDEAPRSSPPSSPTLNSSPPPTKKRRPVFSIFKNQTKPTPIAKHPLLERSHNAQNSPKPRPAKTKRMVQMQLDLASEHRKACKICGMEYIPSNTEDSAVHRKFHGMNLRGVEFTKPIVERLRKNIVWNGDDGSFIAVIGRRDALVLRNRTTDVLQLVNTELAAVPISDEELWSQICAPNNETTPKRQQSSSKRPNQYVDQPSVDRFKTYVYIIGQKCVGVCLVERIWEAYTVLDQEDAGVRTGETNPGPQSSSISISEASSAAMIGISRIWTSNQHRKAGIATRLLDCARSDFLYGLTVEKEKVAFSQPTESGGKLARRWFGCEAGWHVYID
ncbi:sister chromatid cohesion acetyltransferase-like protein Eco1 [Phaeosphaeriaceae sp. PMI808]|nr:sister chromatid cohesion acetyltransferase-like protein Eco1 [Phaeosphaeriaceae sp. PMI808]